jgi:hypothetical protein
MRAEMVQSLVTLKLEAICPSETSYLLTRATRRHVPVVYRKAYLDAISDGSESRYPEDGGDMSFRNFGSSY